MTTRKDIINFAKESVLSGTTRVERLNYCKASLIYIDDGKYVVLRSYATIVGIFSNRTDTFYSFGSYSRTTIQHTYKAARFLGAMRITFLYSRYDRCIEKSLSYGANTFYLDKDLYSDVIDRDFLGNIETLK